jgi:putative transposase
MSPVIMLDWRLRRGAISSARRIFRPEQIINKLREAEVPISQGATIGEASRRIGVTEQTYYRWRREYGGMDLEARRIESTTEAAKERALMAE